MEKYRIGQQVEATVERILPFGVFVRLHDGTRGYIRVRELELDAKVEPANVVQPGQELIGVIIELGKDGKHLELSHRATMKNPWQEFSKQHQVGDVVGGTVQSIVTSGIFVRVAAGINGCVPLEDVSAWEIRRPEEFLWIGDEVEAVITHLDRRNERLSLSIRARLQSQKQTLQLYERFADHAPPDTNRTFEETMGGLSKPIRRLPGKQIGRILVVEDENEIRISLANWLRRRGLVVDQAESLEMALPLLQAESYSIVFLDMNLRMDDGLKLAHLFQTETKCRHTCIMSSADMILERADEILALGISSAFLKPLDMDEIEEFLIHIGRGESAEMHGIQQQSVAPLHGESSTGLKHSRVLDGFHELPTGRLQNALVGITNALLADLGLIFEINAASQVISVLAYSADKNLDETTLSVLHNSPVGDVIREGTPILENHVSRNASAKFDKLRGLLAFESCIGVPIRVQDEIRHAAFFFHSEPAAFRKSQLRDAVFSALLLAAYLEEDVLSRRLLSLSPILLSGELAAGFGHEVFNKISGLEIQVRNMLPVHIDREAIEADIIHLLGVILDLKETAQNFQQIMLAPDKKKTLKINDSVEKAVVLLQPVAYKQNTRLIMRLASDLPVISGNSIAFQQVILNLMLNSIQQMAIKSQNFHGFGPRILEVCTSLNAAGNKILVRVKDSGPGIHRQLWEKIFTPGFSTRGGSGLGLYIAQSFIQQLHGTINIEESFIPLGTTFLIELPLKEGSHD